MTRRRAKVQRTHGVLRSPYYIVPTRIRRHLRVWGVGRLTRHTDQAHQGTPPGPFDIYDTRPLDGRQLDFSATEHLRPTWESFFGPLTGQPHPTPSPRRVTPPRGPSFPGCGESSGVPGQIRLYLAQGGGLTLNHSSFRIRRVHLPRGETQGFLATVVRSCGSSA